MPHATAPTGSPPRAQPDSSVAHRLRQLAGCRAVPGECRRRSAYLVEHGRVGCKGRGRDQRDDRDLDQRKWPGSRKDAEGGGHGLPQAVHHGVDWRQDRHMTSGRGSGPSKIQSV